MKALRSIVIPVLTDALDRSLALAAAMDSRGYGRTGAVPRRTRLLTGFLVVGGLIGVCVGVYGLLDGTAPRYLGLPVLLGGLALAVVGFVIGGRRVLRSVYRPDSWRLAEVVVAGCGIGTAAVLFLTSQVDAANLYPSLNPLTWPGFAVLPVLGILLGAAPAVLAPVPPSSVVRVPQETAR